MFGADAADTNQAYPMFRKRSLSVLQMYGYLDKNVWLCEYCSSVITYSATFYWNSRGCKGKCSFSSFSVK